MANSPMVIMWSNSDDSITLSQRMASSEVMPTVVADPPRVANLSTSLSSVRPSRVIQQCNFFFHIRLIVLQATGSQPQFAYTISVRSSFTGLFRYMLIITLKGQLRYNTKCNMGFRVHRSKFFITRCQPPTTSCLRNLPA